MLYSSHTTNGIVTGAKREVSHTFTHQFAFHSLYRYISALEVVDCHEHLHPEDVRNTQPVDFSSLLSEYGYLDLLNAGMSTQQLRVFFDLNTPLTQKWELFAPYLPSIETTTNYRAVRLTLQKFYGERELTASNYQKITEAMRRRNVPGVYEETFSESRIRHALVCGFPKDVRPHQLHGRCHYVPMYYVPDSSYGHGLMRTPRSLADLEAEADEYIDLALQGARVLKLRVDLTWMPVTLQQAQAALDRLNAGECSFCPEVCWYFTELLLQRCARHDIPVSVHTGYCNDFRISSPESLIPIIDSHPDNRFDLFHLGYPYIKSSLLLAKTYPNVYLNLCWIYIISQEMARDSLRQIVDFLPMNKIMGFGADYWQIDNVYGHRRMMDRILALALADKVADGTLTLVQAKRWAKAMLWDNPARFYGLS